MTVDDLEAIRQLKARYFRCMDTKDWAGMRQVFHDNVRMEVEDENGVIHEGADDFMTFLSGVLDGVITTHHGHMPEIQITSPTTATGIWAMEDMLRWPDGTEMHGYGHYHETYEKIGDDWKIKSSHLTRLRVDFTPAPATA
jgi:hypothetical protein